MKRKNVLWGIYYVLAEALIVLFKMNVLTDVNIIKVIVAIFLLPRVIKGIVKLHFGEIFFPLAVVVIMFENELGVSNIGFWTPLVVAALLSVGFSMIFPKKTSNMKYDGRIESFSEDSLNEVSIESKFSGITKYIDSPALKRVNICNSFGGVNIYIDKAHLSENGAEFIFDSNFSGTEIYLPSSWNVIDNTNKFLSGVGSRGIKNPDPTLPSVVLSGNLSFSGITIVYM